MQASQAMVRSAELNLGFTKIISPIDGIVGIALAQVGALVNPTSGILTTVSTVDPIKVYFNLNEQEYLSYAKGNLIQAQQGAGVRLELELILSDGTTYPQKGRFFVADRQVDPATGAIRLAGVFPNPGNTLRPGQYGRVRAETTTREGRVAGAAARRHRTAGQLPGRRRGRENKVSIRPVKVGERIGAMWIIADGVQAGERVVAEGVQKVGTWRNGQSGALRSRRRRKANHNVEVLHQSPDRRDGDLDSHGDRRRRHAHTLPVAQFPNIAPPEIQVRRPTSAPTRRRSSSRSPRRSSSR